MLTGPADVERPVVNERIGIRRATPLISGAVVALMLLLASPTEALRPNTHPDPCRFSSTSKASKSWPTWSRSVWAPDRWRRGQPPPATIAAQRHRLRCALPGRRPAMRHRWRRDKAIYWAKRRDELWRVRVTPYRGGGRSWAIPYYIVACESGGDYGAQNPTSTAHGAYQLLASTYAVYCRTCDWSRRDQDLAAHRLFSEASTGPWVCG